MIDPKVQTESLVVCIRQAHAGAESCTVLCTYSEAAHASQPDTMLGSNAYAAYLAALREVNCIPSCATLLSAHLEDAAHAQAHLVGMNALPYTALVNDVSLPMKFSIVLAGPR